MLGDADPVKELVNFTTPPRLMCWSWVHTDTDSFRDLLQDETVPTVRHKVEIPLLVVT